MNTRFDHTVGAAERSDVPASGLVWESALLRGEIANLRDAIAGLAAMQFVLAKNQSDPQVAIWLATNERTMEALREQLENYERQWGNCLCASQVN